MSIEWTFWNDRDNIEELVLRNRQEALVTDLSATTRAVLRVSTYTIDSDTSPTALTWDSSVTRTIEVDGVDTSFTGDVITAQLGHESIPVGKYKRCCLILFDNDTSDDGTVWSEDITVTIKDTCDVS